MQKKNDQKEGQEMETAVLSDNDSLGSQELKGEMSAAEDVSEDQELKEEISSEEISRSQTKLQLLEQFIKFGIVGVTNTGVSYGINAATLYLLRMHHPFRDSDFIIGNTVAFILSVLWSFYWNNKLVFDMKGSSKKEMLMALLKMYLSYAFTGIVLSNILSYVWIKMFHISEFVAPLLNSLIGVPINFILNKFWAFQGR